MIEVLIYLKSVDLFTTIDDACLNEGLICRMQLLVCLKCQLAQHWSDSLGLKWHWGVSFSDAAWFEHVALCQS